MTAEIERRTILAAALLAPAAARAADPAPIKHWRHYANGRFGQVHFFSAGPADDAAIKHPPLVCFHPSPTSGDIYREMVPYLATDRVVHCVDTPGFGGSDAPPAKPTMDDYGGAVADALSDLGYGLGGKGTLDLFGFHTGSLVAVATALSRPPLIRRIVLSGVPHYTPEERAKQRAQNVKGYPFFEEREYVPSLYRRLVLDGQDAGPIERRLARFADRMRAGPDGAWGADAVFTYDTGAALPKLTMPVRLIAFNEMMTQPTRDAAKVIPGASLVEMLDLPMFGFIVAPDRVAVEIRAFLDA
ncbi:MAG: alpha/beta fold hydrolase [Rhodospirillaceae bacterium]|nr:alpha/beta fold hydrolase [Rhodospirillaceae bacterium]